jgi:hypothetical protein
MGIDKSKEGLIAKFFAAAFGGLPKSTGAIF